MDEPTISIEGGELLLTIPSPAEGRFQHLRIPCTLSGVLALKRILLAQEAARASQIKKERCIGSDAEPTQEIIKKWLESRPKESPEAFLLDLTGVLE